MFYMAVMGNNLEKYKNFVYIINCMAYDIFEEISLPGYVWTTLHYGMRYDK